jgi:hypothetical protein
MMSWSRDDGSRTAANKLSSSYEPQSLTLRDLKDTRSNAISVGASTQKHWCGVVLRLSLWRA